MSEIFTVSPYTVSTYAPGTIVKTFCIDSGCVVDVMGKHNSVSKEVFEPYPVHHLLWATIYGNWYYFYLALLVVGCLAIGALILHAVRYYREQNAPCPKCNHALKLHTDGNGPANEKGEFPGECDFNELVTGDDGFDRYQWTCHCDLWPVDVKANL